MNSSKHFLYDVWVKDAEILKWAAPWRELLLDAAQKSGATIVGQGFHQFEPWGVTGFVLLAESHISVHTWPEKKLASIDIFTCGDMDTDLILRRLQDWLEPQKEKLTVVSRGRTDQPRF